MRFTQYYLGCLSQASYLIGDETTGRAAVVDPRRDVGEYLRDAATAGLRVEYVIETHVHADFLSGHLELAALTDATVIYGAGADVRFPHREVADGERLDLGQVALEILATPGHTPESICIVVYEHPDDEVPYGVLTGDTLFVGDVGRPDLLASAGADLSAPALARRLHHSLHGKLLRLPDATRVFPAHGAGSSCGKQLSSETSSTIGEQRLTNYALQPMAEDEFVAAVTEGQPARPQYFEFDARRNRELRPLLDEAAPPVLSIAEVLSRRDAGAVLLDAREPADFAAGHVRGAVNVGLRGRFAEWAGAVLSPERDVVLVGDPAIAVEARVRLGRVGYDTVVGQLDDLASAFTARPELIEASSRLTIEQLAELRTLEPALQVVDVRSPGETTLGTLPGAREIPLATLTRSLDGLDRFAPVLVYCASGYRSQVAASVLLAAGFADVSDLVGGYRTWEGAGLPVALEGTPGVRAVPEVGARAAKALAEAGALMLDVREPGEWQAGHAPQASHLPMGQVLDRRSNLPQDCRIVVVCRSGGRSAAVTESLRAWGFDAVNLSGGMCAWDLAGLPVVTAERSESALLSAHVAADRCAGRFLGAPAVQLRSGRSARLCAGCRRYGVTTIFVPPPCLKRSRVCAISSRPVRSTSVTSRPLAAWAVICSNAARFSADATGKSLWPAMVISLLRNAGATIGADAAARLATCTTRARVGGVEDLRDDLAPDQIDDDVIAVRRGTSQRVVKLMPAVGDGHACVSADLAGSVQRPLGADGGHHAPGSQEPGGLHGKAADRPAGS